MDNLKVALKNCYGIQSLEFEFDFSQSNGKSKAFAVYAPNGLMKTSFSRTFEKLSIGENPTEERYGRQSTYVVEADGSTISSETIYVLKSELDISTDSPAITNILVDPENKARYDNLHIELDNLKNKLISRLQKISKVKKTEVEKSILADWDENDFAICITRIIENTFDGDLSPYEYATIFDPKTIEILKTQEFITKASEFNERYQELFDQAGSLYKKGVFNPTKAETSFGTLDKQGFFAGGHRIHLNGESTSIDKNELDAKLKAIHARIDSDDTLRKIRTNLAKNAQTQALAELIETLSATQVELLLEKLKPQNQSQFRRELWTYYIHSSEDAGAYLESYIDNRNEIEAIEAAAAIIAPKWAAAVNLFNDRFVDMPFKLSVANQAQAVLGKEKAQLIFTFEDGDDTVECLRDVAKTTLSQGEKRALYLLNFIFEVEERKQTNKETLFIIDDVADSFDYKNKHAIIQYLDDLCETSYFYQIILTHNFDFFRTLASNGIIHRDRCLMANRNNSSITLSKAEGVNNYFIGVMKGKVSQNERSLCASIPFTRNLIEYTKGTDDPNYIKLTSLLHWKNDSDSITVGNYLTIFNGLFGTTHNDTSDQSMKGLIFAKAEDIRISTAHEGLNLEDKVLLSIAIRMKAEIFITDRLRILRGDPLYWYQGNSQFGRLMKEFSSQDSTSPALYTLEKVGITVSSNIHLNSFMYEPILDLTIDHLIELYNEVCNL